MCSAARGSVEVVHAPCTICHLSAHKLQELQLIYSVDRVLKSGLVRFFCLFWAQPDHNRFFYFPKIIGPQSNPYQLVACGCVHQSRPVVTGFGLLMPRYGNSVMCDKTLLACAQDSTAHTTSLLCLHTLFHSLALMPIRMHASPILSTRMPICMQLICNRPIHNRPIRNRPTVHTPSVPIHAHPHTGPSASVCIFIQDDHRWSPSPRKSSVSFSLLLLTTYLTYLPPALRPSHPPICEYANPHVQAHPHQLIQPINEPLVLHRPSHPHK